MSATMITNFFSTTGKRKPDHVDVNNNEDTSKRQKTAKPVVSKEQAITASLKTLLK
jgi:hypothetical protein